MLSFLNPLFLISIPLAVIPIIINLIRPRVRLHIKWPSLYLLRRAEKKKVKRRIKLLEVILTALRVLIILTAVLLAARPYVSTGGDAVRRDIVVVLDDSLSMGYEETAGTRMVRARELAGNVISGTDEGDRIAVITTSRPYDNGWLLSGEANRRIEAANPESVGRIGLGLAVAAGVLADSDNKKEIHLITDCQETAFTDWPYGLPGDVKIYIHDAREEGGPYGNLAFTGYRVAATVPPAAFVKITTFGDHTQGQVFWESGTVAVGRGGDEMVKVPISTGGNTTISLEDDSFLFDNSMEIPSVYGITPSYYIAPQVSVPYFGAAFASLGAEPSAGNDMRGVSIAVCRFGSIPDGTGDYVEKGGLLLLVVGPGDRGEAWNLRLDKGLTEAPGTPLRFLPPLYDAAAGGGPPMDNYRPAEYGPEWAVACEADGVPMILYRSLGEGEVWVLLIPTTAGSELPLHPVFVALVGDILMRVGEFKSGVPRSADLYAAESTAVFLTEGDFAEKYPGAEYIPEDVLKTGGWSLDLTLPLAVILLLLLAGEPILAGFVTRKIR